MSTPTGEPVRDHALRAAFGPAPSEPAWFCERPTPAGEVLAGGRYRLRREVGRGGQGSVHLADDLVLGRPVAVKLLSNVGRMDEAMLVRFRREAEVASRLEVPGICTVYDAGLTGDVPFIAMRWIEGETLAHRIQRLREAPSDGITTTPEISRGGKGLGDVLDGAALVENIARALHAAHEAGVIHRDMKPGNVMVTPEGEPVILDFGLAHVVDEAGAALTRPGEIFGTPAYMAPEQLTGGTVRIDQRADIFALGVTLFELLTLQRPFDAPTREGLLDAIRRQDPPDPRALNPAIPADLAIVIAAALEKDRDRRYQTAEALAEDLRRVRTREPIRARPVTRWVRFARWAQRNPALVATGSAAVFLLLAGTAAATFLAWRARENLLAYNRLADMAVLEELQRAESEDLWPAEPRLLEAMGTWLDRARALVDRLPGHAADLARLRESAHSYTAAAQERDRASHRDENERLAALAREAADARRALEAFDAAGAEASANAARRERLDEKLSAAETELEEERARLEPVLSLRRTWEFDDPVAKWRHQKLAELVSGLERFAGAGPREPGISSIEARMEFARTLHERTVAGPAGAWAACRERIAANPRYAGIACGEQLGLVPLGPDPATGLEEFSETATGAVPERDARGRIVVTESMAIVLVLLPGGRFDMGAQRRDPTRPNHDPDAEVAEGPVHSVVVAPFLLSKFEVTQGQWLRATGRNPSNLHPGIQPAFTGRPDLRHPVEQISIDDSAGFCARLGLRLPAEAEWEYACRAGSASPWWCGGRAEDLATLANLADEHCRTHGGPAGGWVFASWDDGFAIHAPVGSLRPNAFGLHDVHGNVWECCGDAYGPYSGGPAGTASPRLTFGERTSRVHRGGAWSGTASSARSSNRLWNDRGARTYELGCRPARDLRPPAEAP